MIYGKAIIRILILGLAFGQLFNLGCLHAPTIEQNAYKPFAQGQPIPESSLQEIRDKSPKDAVFADLLQAFALMRTKDLNNKKVRQEIFGLLATSVASFEDMTDPENFSLAFSLDEDKAYRGRPHERMFASTMAAIFLMVDKRYGEALPYLRNAEFLDARFQKMPFGTDAPLVYALMYRCLKEQKAAAIDIEHAQSGVFRSIRFLTLKKVFLDAMVAVADGDIRKSAFTRRLSYMIYEISMYYSLMTAPQKYDAFQLLDDAASQADIFIAALNTHFSDEYKARMKPLMEELAKVHGLNKKTGIKHLEEIAFSNIAAESRDISNKMKRIFTHQIKRKNMLHQRMSDVLELSEKVLKAASADKMILTFSGTGPSIVRQGSYHEITVIRPSLDSNKQSFMREKTMKLSQACGFHRTSQGGFSLVLCKSNAPDYAEPVLMPALEVFSSSDKAMSAQGREFDKILRNRAQFREATETIAEVSAWSAFFLFYLGAELMADCQRTGQSEACYTKGLVVWGIAGVTVIFSGTIWLIGRSKNPAADSRYIHLMYESVWLAI